MKKIKKMKFNFFKYCIAFLLFFVGSFFAFGQESVSLTEEEVSFLKNKNNTLSVYLAKNDPIFSFQNPGGNIQGLSVDYLNLIAKKFNLKINYLEELPKNQIIYNLGIGVGDLAVGLNQENISSPDFIFSNNYVSVPAVILGRIDVYEKSQIDLSEFKDKKIAVIAGSSLFFYIKNNYPDIVLENVLNNEEVLQKIFLGEVDAGIMDTTSFSYFLSTQSLKSIRIVGNTDFKYDLSLLMTKDNFILKQILNKGINLITDEERNFLTDKWVNLSNFNPITDSSYGKNYFDLEINEIYFLVGIIFVLLLIFFFIWKNRKKLENKNWDVFKQDLEDIKKINESLRADLEEVKENEATLQAILKDRKEK